MKAMARQRSHSIEFKRQVAQEFIAGESLYALSKRHDISRQLIRVWVQKYEAGALDEDAQAADLLQEYEAKIAALERMVGRQALEIEFLKGALKNAPRPRSVNTLARRRLHRRRMPANGDSSLYFLRHARCPRARPDHRCGDENDLRRVRSLWLSAC
jgi:transposase-like protein